jgi:hypothetical protein
MQALLSAASGTRLSKSTLNCTCVHQHGLGAAAPGVAMTQRLACPHKGHKQGSTGEQATLMAKNEDETPV